MPEPEHADLRLVVPDLGICALQLWAIARADPADAIERYVRVCRLGGTLPFRALMAAAGLGDPFDPGVLTDVIRGVRDHLQRSAATCAGACET